jgi:O-antigen/teichoic acid export membrane protein
MTAVTYYVTPNEVVSRAQLLPLSIMSVLFPAMTTAMVNGGGRLASLYGQGAHVLLLLMLPVTAAFFLLAPEALGIWLGPDFSETSTPVLQWLALGLLVNTLAKLPFSLLQSVGRPDLVAKVHLVELIPYGLVLWSLTTAYGITGTAAAWYPTDTVRYTDAERNCAASCS